MQVLSGLIYLEKNPNNNIKTVIAEQKLPIFFKDIDEYKEVVSKSSISEIYKLLSLLNLLEKRVKLNGEKIYFLERLFLEFNSELKI